MQSQIYNNIIINQYHSWKRMITVILYWWMLYKILFQIFSVQNKIWQTALSSDLLPAQFFMCFLLLTAMAGLQVMLLISFHARHHIYWQHILKLTFTRRPCPLISKHFLICNFFFLDTASFHTHLANLAANLDFF